MNKELGIDIDLMDDRECRNIYLTDDITQSSVDSAVQRIIEINQEDTEGEETKVKFKRKPIHVFISSYGGDAYAGFGVYDIIRSSKTPVYTYCQAKAMSAGLMIYMAGHKKIMYKYSTLMYHSVASFSYGKIQTMKEDLEEATRLQIMYDEIVLKGSKIKKSKLKQVVKDKFDWFISSEEALELGACDEVL